MPTVIHQHQNTRCLNTWQNVLSWKILSKIQAWQVLIDEQFCSNTLFSIARNSVNPTIYKRHQVCIIVMWKTLDKTVSSKFFSSELQQKLKYSYISKIILTFRNHYKIISSISLPIPSYAPHMHTLPCTSLLEINVACNTVIKLGMKCKFSFRIRLKSEIQLSIIQFPQRQQTQSRQILKSGIIPTL